MSRNFWLQKPEVVTRKHFISLKCLPTETRQLSDYDLSDSIPSKNWTAVIQATGCKHICLGQKNTNKVLFQYKI